MAQAKRDSSATFVVVSDQEIQCTSDVLGKLPVMNCNEARVRSKLRHFLQHLRNLGFTEDWDVLFRDDRLVKRIEQALASHRKKSDSREWISGVRFGNHRHDGKATGLIFRRSCYRGVYPTPSNEAEAGKADAVATNVELGFTVKRQTKGFHFTVYRFTEWDRDEVP